MTGARRRLLHVMMLALALFALLAVGAVLAAGAIGADRRMPTAPVAVRRDDDGSPALDGGLFAGTPAADPAPPVLWPL
ncbi:hypothetical protein ACFVU2_05675 [Leifsonia sp. NPDC058194]|uniref:hypothetical protein n=1 Tax=Leifsonia sp. NPDC058194 TaxID=3346374 RepID=UPI0036DA0598